LPLPREEAIGPNLIGSSPPIISWFSSMHQTNVATSFFLSPQATIATKTQQQKQ